MTWWAAFTFKWMTVALPLLAAVCVAVALHQIRSFRQHNRGLKAYTAAQEARLTDAQDTAKLGQLIADARQELDGLRATGPREQSFGHNAAAACAHGRSTGRSERLRRLSGGGIYDEVAAAVYASLGSKGGVQ